MGGSTSSGISLGNLWIIPPVLMKVVRIKNADVHRGQDRDGAWAKRRREWDKNQEAIIVPHQLIEGKLSMKELSDETQGRRK